MRKFIYIIIVSLLVCCMGADIIAEEVSQQSLPDVNTLIYHARQLRNMLAEDPYRPKYHFVPPEGFWNDVNGMMYWKGRYHLFYLCRAIKPGATWGHSSSIDLVHWIHHPFGLVPKYDGSMPRGIFSGDAMDNMDVPTIIAHVPQQGTCIWQAKDDMLLNWKPLAENPVIKEAEAPKEVRVFDTAGWKEGDTYYSLIGNVNYTPGFEGDSSSLFKSSDLKSWEYVGPFYKSDRKWTMECSDAACIDFYPLQDKYMIISHIHLPYAGSQYYIGSYEKGKRFIPEQHGFLSGIPHQVKAPETMVDDKGRRIFMAWSMSDHRPAWKSLSVLPRVFSLDKKGRLEQKPVEELKKLRHNHRKLSPVTLSGKKDESLDSIRGTCIEIGVTVKGGDYNSVGVKVFQATDGSEETIIGYDRTKKVLFIDFGKSKKGGVTALKWREGYVKKYKVKQEHITRHELPFELSDKEDLDLQIFIDQSIVEVFANNRQVVVQNVYPEDVKSNRVSLFSEGGKAKVSRIEAWDMHWTNVF